MKKIKRIFAIILLILMLVTVGYTFFTCSRTTDIIEEGESYEKNI